MKILILLITLTFGSTAEELKFRGKALLEYSIFGIDLYTISYFESESKSHRKLTLNYERDIKREHSIEGWKVGFQNNIQDLNEYKSQIDWINSNTPDMKEGDQFDIIIQDMVVIFKKNGKELARLKDKTLVELAHMPWIGVKPVDEKAKKKLLGK